MNPGKRPVSPSLRIAARAVCAALAVLLVVPLAARRRALAAQAATDVRGHASDVRGHMTMTSLRPAQPGDRERADAIAAAARAAAEPYRDFHKALADGYVIFHPEWKQSVYHFTDNEHAFRNTMRFDASHPTSLLYERTPPAVPGGDPGYKLLGVMYTAPFSVSEEELNKRVPLSMARWRLHTNLCIPPAGQTAGLAGPKPKFGLAGSITTADACIAAGGTFLPHLFGWMVHVYPFEADPAKVWSAGEQDMHDMSRDPMPAGMTMPAGHTD